MANLVFWFAYFYILMVHLVSLAFGMAYLLHGMENWVLSDNFITIFAFGERVQHRWLWQIWTVDSCTVNWKKLVLPSFKAARSHIIFWGIHNWFYFCNISCLRNICISYLISVFEPLFLSSYKCRTTKLKICTKSKSWAFVCHPPVSFENW